MAMLGTCLNRVCPSNPSGLLSQALAIETILMRVHVGDIHFSCKYHVTVEHMVVCLSQSDDPNKYLHFII
jgi:hypothetical protein